jgi:hypothetical protein
VEPRKRKLLLIGAIMITLVAGFCFFLVRNSEPTYNGKPLSYWVQMYSRLDLGFGDEEKAAAAIRAIGTNALPFLLKWTDYEPTKLDEWFGSNYNELPEWMTAPGPFQWRRRAHALSVHARANRQLKIVQACGFW